MVWLCFQETGCSTLPTSEAQREKKVCFQINGVPGDHGSEPERQQPAYHVEAQIPLCHSSGRLSNTRHFRPVKQGKKCLSAHFSFPQHLALHNRPIFKWRVHFHHLSQCHIPTTILIFTSAHLSQHFSRIPSLWATDPTVTASVPYWSFVPWNDHSSSTKGAMSFFPASKRSVTKNQHLKV